MKTKNKYDAVSRFFHWTTALFIFALLIVGLLMTDMAVSQTKIQIYGLHKSLGLTVLGLGVMRLLWRIGVPAPKSLDTHARYERLLAKTIHIVFYISIICMPLSGWFMSSAGEYPSTFFGLFAIPRIIPKDPALFSFFREVHELFAYTLIGSIILHVTGALKHHLIDRDKTLQRMGASLPIALIGLALWAGIIGILITGQFQPEQPTQTPTASSPFVFAPTPLTTGEAAHPTELAQKQTQEPAQKWFIDPIKSSIAFQFAQSGQPVNGYFESWNGSIKFDPENPQTGAVSIHINANSIKTGSDDRDQQARGADWFAVTEHPAISFQSNSFKALGPQRFEVSGFLSLRGLRQPVSFPFDLEITQDKSGQKTAIMSGTLTLSRLSFGIGQGIWQETKTISDDVEIRLKVTANTR
ncbi:MAG: cytochrome b/b6 domain-containing protein [Alphaproteobacteria bacterium]|nr:cytochrome b/b6 domain-containing protein [Alphaproteobacteria bacterium]